MPSSLLGSMITSIKQKNTMDQDTNNPNASRGNQQQGQGRAGAGEDRGAASESGQQSGRGANQR
jgi:hypothetical protein